MLPRRNRIELAPTRARHAFLTVAVSDDRDEVPERILRPTVARRVSAIPAKGHLPVAVEMTPSTIETVSVRARSILVGPYLPRGRNRPEVCHQRFLATVGAPFDPGHLGLYRSELCNRSRLTTHPHGRWKAILERPAWRGTLP